MQHLIEFFSQYKFRESSSGYHRFVDPLDTSKHCNAVVNFERNFVENHKLGYRTTIVKFYKDVVGCSYEDAKLFVGDIATSFYCNIPKSLINKSTYLKTCLPDEYLPLYHDSFYGERCRLYWKERGLSIDKLIDKGWGYCEEGKYKYRTIIPYKVLGKSVYFQARSFMNQTPKYLFPSEPLIGKSDLVYNQDALYRYDWGFMVEGAVDAECVGDNCIALGGWKLSSAQIDLIRKSKWKELHIIPDKGFELKAKAASFYFKDKMDVYLHTINPEVEGKDVNEVGLSNIIFSTEKIK